MQSFAFGYKPTHQEPDDSVYIDELENMYETLDLMEDAIKSYKQTVYIKYKYYCMFVFVILHCFYCYAY